ncbi:MAG TPA: polysaccharide ABC transporter ATP-binding protein [Verrucomicrobiae bacterium]|nr:polysaccharide ABC transporter ATP-binding protein [Verrucomicrobiae bacterium]
MSSIVSVENLGKKYQLRHQGGQGDYLALRDVLAEGARSLGRRLLGGGLARQRVEREDFWALQEVSFSVNEGDRIGIIGRNGAGKSTLLKVLSRITEPSTGLVRIRGRVASLLEVGTGFHPELTGRENIFLNGAILGMSRAEIARKFDEIVSFAEVERFLDTPVKRYSSGMYVRLAFAVAAHLEPEILVVDEVLAVGDLQFQKKCLGKMNEVSTREGRTVLFVSHNLQAVRQLCNRCLLLQGGRLLVDAEPADTLDQYLKLSASKDGQSMESRIAALPVDPAFRLEEVTLMQNGEEAASSVGNGDELTVSVAYTVLQRTTGLRVHLDLVDEDEMLLFRTFHDEDGDGIPVMEPGRYRSVATIPGDLLAPARYQLRVLATVFNVRMCIPYPGLVLHLDVERTGRSNRAYPGEPVRGKLAPYIPWQTIPAGPSRGGHEALR